jgi:hypothetical protein
MNPLYTNLFSRILTGFLRRSGMKSAKQKHVLLSKKIFFVFFVIIEHRCRQFRTYLSLDFPKTIIFIGLES